jgi:sec-independent protein translocase protein TatA|tara:strand:- start:532 stop:732 length:201 start_codon:yes stop_codon:yes gene_type:complete
MWTPGIGELAIIMIIVVLVFGTGKLSGVGKSLGTAIHDFKASVKPEDKDKDDTPAADVPSDAEKTE